jgi:dephospho-CoA kinase
MDVYGLTGGIGSGKSTVAALLEEYGVPVVSADELSRIVVAPGSEGLQDVVRLFGPQVLDERGELDRRKMAAIVFYNPHQRKELEQILHPRIRDRFEQVLDALEKAGHEVAVYEVPLLFEKNLQGEMKAVILVSADEDVRIARVQGRDDVTETEVRARIAAQMDEQTKRRKADYIIDNNGSMDELRREVEFMLARFLRLRPSSRPWGGDDETEESSTLDEVPVRTGATLPPVEADAPFVPASEAPTLPAPVAAPLPDWAARRPSVRRAGLSPRVAEPIRGFARLPPPPAIVPPNVLQASEGSVSDVPRPARAGSKADTAVGPLRPNPLEPTMPNGARGLATRSTTAPPSGDRPPSGDSPSGDSPSGDSVAAPPDRLSHPGGLAPTVPDDWVPDETGRFRMDARGDIRIAPSENRQPTKEGDEAESTPQRPLDPTKDEWEQD